MRSFAAEKNDRGGTVYSISANGGMITPASAPRQNVSGQGQIVRYVPGANQMVGNWPFQITLDECAARGVLPAAQGPVVAQELPAQRHRYSAGELRP